MTSKTLWIYVNSLLLKEKMSKIILIGAGSTNFGLGTIGDIFKSKILSGSTIVLHDINKDALKNSETIRLKSH